MIFYLKDGRKSPKKCRCDPYWPDLVFIGALIPWATKESKRVAASKELSKTPLIIYIFISYEKLRCCLAINIVQNEVSKAGAA